MRPFRRNTLRRPRRHVRPAPEWLEDRTTPAGPQLPGPGFYYDPATMDACIVGTDANDRFTLFADPDGDLHVTHNGKPLPAFDPTTNQPVQIAPAVTNTDSIQALLRAGDDVFEIFGDRLEQVGIGHDGGPGSPPIEILGEAGNDVLTVQAAAGIIAPSDFPLAVRFDGGIGTGDGFRLMATDQAEALSWEGPDFNIALRALIDHQQSLVIMPVATESFVADMRGGDDVVAGELQTGQDQPVIVAIELGFGDDLLELSGQMETGRLDIRGGAGSDAIDLRLAAVAIIMPPVVVGIDLGIGDDVLNFDFQGSVQQVILGGSGADVVDLVGLTAPGDNHWSIFADLGTHDDVLNFHWQPADPAAQLGSQDINLTVLGGSGGDVVELVGLTSPSDNHWNILANLGAHDDEFGFVASAAGLTTPDSNTTLRLNVLAGTGNDVVDLAGLVGPCDDVWNVWVNLGTGRDIASMRFLVAAPTPNSPVGTPTQLNVTANGGAGADEIEARVDAAGMQNVGLRGGIRLLGGQGNDELGLLVSDYILGLNLQIHGGIGSNTAITHGKVRVFNANVTSVSAVGKW